MTPDPPPSPVLVIGFGNPLRRDDALGPLAAEEVARWGVPGVAALAVPQLLPELAEPLAAARLAIFVDARIAVGEPTIDASELAPDPSAPSLGHLGDPCRLLALARGAFGSSPRALLVTAPAFDLALGEGLSPGAEAGLDLALRRIAEILSEDGIGGVPPDPAGQPTSPPSDTAPGTTR